MAVPTGAGFGTSRDDLIARLGEAGIDCSVHFIPIHHLPYYRRLLGEPGSLRSIDAVSAEFVSLPFHQGLEDSAVQRVCDAIWSVHRTSQFEGVTTGV